MVSRRLLWRRGANMGKYSRVYWICIFEGVESLFTRWDFFLSIYWGSRLDILLFILSFCLSIVNFLVIYFIFGISCVEVEFQRLCIIDFYFCFFETLLKVSRILEFLLIFFLFRHDNFLVIYRKFF